jgi:hypothetical protein
VGTETIYRVRDVNEAIALAEQFKKEHRYHYFRGQRDARWSLEPSFGRLDQAGQEKHREELSYFASWAKSAAEVVPYLQSDDQILAAAQHHGVAKTPFIDLTTDPRVAGFFAVDGAVQGDLGTILLFDPDDFMSVINVANKSFGLNIHFVSVDVTNLWRLQAQSGLFLEAQMRIDDFIYPPDRIEFPHNLGDPPIDRRLIYPDRESHLEQQINDYKLRRKESEGLRELLKGHDGRPGPLHVEFQYRGFDAEQVNLRPWSVDPVWAAGPDEDWEDVKTSLCMPPPLFTVSDLLNRSQQLRAAILERRNNPDLLKLAEDDFVDGQSLQEAIDRFWQGSRFFPYSADQLETALLTMIRLRRGLAGALKQDGTPPDSFAKLIIEDAVEILMVIAGGGTSRAFVTIAGLRGAIRPEAAALIGLDDSDSSSMILVKLLPYGELTSRLFDASAFIELFAREIIPWQVAHRRDIIVWSPFHVTALGLP